MRVFATLALAVGLTALTAGDSHAQNRQRPGNQPPGGGRGMGMMGGMNNPATLLLNKGVQEELKLSEEQISTLTKVGESMRTKMTDLRPKIQEAMQDGGFEKVQEIMKPVMEEITKEVEKVLKPEQAARLKQIVLQQGGILAAARDSELAKKLKLNEEQITKVKKIAEELQADQRELFPQMRDNPQETQKKLATVRKEAADKAVAVLTAEQKTAWTDMIGKPFEVKMEQGRRPGGGRPPGGNPPPPPPA